MECFHALSLTCILCLLSLLYVKPLDTQSISPVVDIQLSNYPNNVLRVAEYASSGNIAVELSEVVRNNEVEVTCQTLSSETGRTKIKFKKGTISVGRKDGTVSFDIVLPGHVVEVQCSGQSINGGSQFQTATSTGNKGYIQVTKRPTVSVCSDVIVVPLNTPPLRTVEVLFSENVTTDPVNVSCSVLSPVKVGSVPMKLKFSAKLAPVGTMKIKVPYALESKGGDAVIVACRAASESTLTPVAKLQYTLDTSQGDTAVFTYQVPQATFIPASISSLGRTTIGRTVSYLVLEEPARNLTEFHCSLTTYNSSENSASLCSGPRLQTSLELTSVVVNLVSTNMTFEIGDLFKPLVVQVNGSSTHRDQRLLEVTCCRRNTDPTKFVLATTISLWIDVFPSVQFKWSNVSGESNETPYSQFDRQCPCDLAVARCDIGCCCDKDCAAAEKEAFPCIPGFFGGASSEKGFEYGCQETWSIGNNYLAMLCVVTDNNPFLGMLYEFSSSPAGDSVQFDSLRAMARTSPYEYRESEGRSLDEDDVISSGYRDGIIVKTDTGILTLPQGIGAGACAQYAPVVFLRNADTWCSGEFSESMCSGTSPWSALDYLVPSNARQSSCTTSPQVLSVRSGDNSTEVPTYVAYFCTKDPSLFTTADEQNWGSSEQKGSFFESTKKTGDGFDDVTRCAHDDGVSKPASPRFNASSSTCFNVVLKVEYDLYWRAAEIVQVRVKVTMGDVASSVGKLFVAQRFSVKFIHLKDVDRTRLPFIERQVNERSGNPGYLIGKKVLAKIEKNESVVLDLALNVNQTTLGELGLWSPTFTGLCADAKTSQVSFGVNSLSGCLVRLTLKDMANCSELRQTVLRNQQDLVKATHVARRGNAVLNESKDWVPLLWPPAPLPSTNVSDNQTFGTCDNIPASLHYELLVKEAGTHKGVAQMEIFGARVRYSLHSWAFQCISHNCKSCNVTATNGTTLCKDSVQSFDITSSVAFTTILGNDMIRKKRSADTSNICYQDACAAEVFYPLTTSYDGETREVAISYGLMVIALALLILSLTTSWLRTIRQWTMT